MNNRLWYQMPAETFDRVLPIGNGSFGACIYGQAPREKISLNNDTFWSGTPSKDIDKISYETLSQIQNLVIDQNFRAAEKKIEQNLLGSYNESYMPFGVFWYEIKGISDISDYSRELNIERSIHRTEYAHKSGKVKTEVFASFPAQCIAGKIEVTAIQPIVIEFGLESELKHSVYCENDGMILVMQAPSHVEPNYVNANDPIQYDPQRRGMPGVLQLKIRGNGIMEHENGHVCIRGTEKVEFFLSAATGYQGYALPIEFNENKICMDLKLRMKQVYGKTYRELRKDHIDDYTKLYSKSSLLLDDERQSNIPTDQRIRNFKESPTDMGLFELFFNYSKYLLISSSRSGSQPANLQGIWSENLRPVWSCNWTTNINLEMNYWSAASSNLLDCFEPLLQMVEELSQSGAITAREQFHCRGWTANHNADIWRQTTPVGGKANYAYWPMGGVWLVNQLCEYWRYTMDIPLLSQRIFPLLKGAVRFCLDWMKAGADGFVHTVPSTSPENYFIDMEGKKCSVSFSSTMDISLVRELFENLISSCNILQIKDNLYEETIRQNKRLPTFKICADGTLQEWFFDFQESDPGHRHFSHLSGLYPGRTINKRKSPHIMNAVEKSLEKRLLNGGGKIGWSCAWAINLYAKLENAKGAYSSLKRLLTESVYENLFDLHPPLGEGYGEREVFQIDGNFGGAAGIESMLLSCQDGYLVIFPALPPEWKKGHAAGFLIEGGFEVEIKWENNRCSKLCIYSPFGGDLFLRTGSAMECRIDESLQKRIIAEEEYFYLKTQPGQKYELCKE